MNREETTLLGFEIVAYAGDARSKFLEALKEAQEGDYAKAEELIAAGSDCLNDAHNAQTSLLQKEGAGDDLAYSVTLMHGQDHLMTTILLQDLMKHMIELYKRGAK
ncbi:TPA: PTS lactose/cellobiose transporter subunit IIA [Streptococcus pyogenes]|uniref:PTS lactose/cellobiose transporter subunit IIA n=1 Tax=Streptococcus pyogenes TaxID=1314 RepID=UPI0007C25219|nr:PTS lactose/cellobiose transporter subunit IIA [Streptococcus pyogenes]OAC48153.1 PTS lactose transporter subunit IIA [Streptococcus pyogenes]OAC56799.1 PTS lactose transporter subunit IIA [Streptococcus pyogenes]OAC77471.1 PTS lactose transporter subunit IIA [Streptococcus pyogenes]HEQ9421878.1 PTS lactose/cellobiose transporter subunit IIA [Streptococcus pyogenes]